MRTENENVNKEKEHIKISIRPNDKNKDFLSTLKIEARKNGYEICEAKEKDRTNKPTDIVPWDTNWVKTEGNINMKKRLKNYEKEPEPPKMKLARDQ
mgnify:CR=1 FL=1